MNGPETIAMLRTVSLIGALALLCAHAMAADRCVDIAIPKAAIAAHDGKWVALTPEQYQFTRGIFAMNPRTAPGLPFGDRAVIATIKGDDGALIFFLDGAKACDAMPIPAVLIAMVMDVAAGKIEHEGTVE